MQSLLAQVPVKEGEHLLCVSYPPELAADGQVVGLATIPGWEALLVFLPTSKELVGNLLINLRWISLILISESVGFRLAFQKKKKKRGGGAVVFCGVSFIFHAILYISVWLWNK